MRKVEILRPFPEILIPPPQCSAPVYGTPFSQENGSRANRAAKKGIKVNQCHKSARYKIDDKPYCAGHAGALALEILIKENT